MQINRSYKIKELQDNLGTSTLSHDTETELGTTVKEQSNNKVMTCGLHYD
jgi:hypothetical protein